MTQANSPFVFHQGTAPLLISMPHAGTALPAEIAGALNDAARQVPDTDWHMPALYAGAQALGASVLAATYSRYGSRQSVRSILTWYGGDAFGRL